MSDVKAIAFDFDGVLCDTGLLHSNALAEAIMRVAEAEISFEDIVLRLEALGTVPSREKLKVLGYGARADQIYNKKQEILFRQEVPDFGAGVVGALRLCSEVGKRACIVSNTSYAFVSRFMQKWPGLFTHPWFFPIITNDWGLPPKPHPEPYLMAARLIGVEPSEMLAVEDSPNGCVSALRAGCKLLHVENPNQLTRERLSQCL